MQIVIDKEPLVNTFAIALFAIGNDYQAAKDCVNEILDNIGYTPLPKGHGRLIDVRDAELAKFTLPQKDGDDYEYASAWNETIDAIIENMPTIVRADGEGNNADSD